MSLDRKAKQIIQRYNELEDGRRFHTKNANIVVSKSFAAYKYLDELIGDMYQELGEINSTTRSRHRDYVQSGEFAPDYSAGSKYLKLIEQLKDIKKYILEQIRWTKSETPWKYDLDFAWFIKDAFKEAIGEGLLVEEQEDSEESLPDDILDVKKLNDNNVKRISDSYYEIINPELEELLWDLIIERHLNPAFNGHGQENADYLRSYHEARLVMLYLYGDWSVQAKTNVGSGLAYVWISPDLAENIINNNVTKEEIFNDKLDTVNEEIELTDDEVPVDIQKPEVTKLNRNPTSGKREYSPSSGYGKFKFYKIDKLARDLILDNFVPDEVGEIDYRGYTLRSPSEDDELRTRYSDVIVTDYIIKRIYYNEVSYYYNQLWRCGYGYTYWRYPAFTIKLSNKFVKEHFSNLLNEEIEILDDEEVPISVMSFDDLFHVVFEDNNYRVCRPEDESAVVNLADAMGTKWNEYDYWIREVADKGYIIFDKNKKDKVFMMFPDGTIWNKNNTYIPGATWVADNGSKEMWEFFINKKIPNLSTRLKKKVGHLLMTNVGDTFIYPDNKDIAPETRKNLNFTKAIIRDGTKRLVQNALSNLKYIKTIEIPSSVKIIGSYAFSGCQQLEKVILPEGVTKIGRGAFSNCSSLKELYIPSSVTEIESYVVWNSNKDLVIKCGMSQDNAQWLKNRRGYEATEFGPVNGYWNYISSKWWSSDDKNHFAKVEWNAARPAVTEEIEITDDEVPLEIKETPSGIHTLDMEQRAVLFDDLNELDGRYDYLLNPDHEVALEYNLDHAEEEFGDDDDEAEHYPYCVIVDDDYDFEPTHLTPDFAEKIINKTYNVNDYDIEEILSQRNPDDDDDDWWNWDHEEEEVDEEIELTDEPVNIKANPVLSHGSDEILVLTEEGIQRLLPTLMDVLDKRSNKFYYLSPTGKTWKEFREDHKDLDLLKEATVVYFPKNEGIQLIVKDEGNGKRPTPWFGHDGPCDFICAYLNS